MEQYLIYLRKSRKDQELELQTGSFDTLRRHRNALLALAEQRGYAVAGILEEVVSGDTIAQRPEMQKLLAAVETGKYAGVLVMEVPRLARGNTRDQGVVAETFQYSGTKIITPDKIYDPADEADEEYFEFGLFMSRREYKAINRRLQRGRLASLDEGKFVAGTAPYGYRKVRILHQKGYTLEPDPEKAGVVQAIFHLYTAGEPQPDGTVKPLGSRGIANLLNARGTPSPGGVQWTAAAVRDVLKNPTYAGYLRWAYRPVKKQMVDGSVVRSTPVNRDMPLRKGLHPPIISGETWTAAQSVMASRSHAPIPEHRKISNPLAGLVYCSVCGRSLVQLPQGNRGAPLLLCPTAGCASVGSRRDVVEAALLDGLRDWLGRYRISAPGGETGGEQELARVLARARRELTSLSRQRDSLYDLLERGVYTQDIFLERSRILSGRIAAEERQIQSLEAYLSSLREAADAQKSLVPKLRHILDLYSSLETPAEQNALLKSVLDHAVYHKSVGGRYRESDMRLYVFPKIFSAEDRLYSQHT